MWANMTNSLVGSLRCGSGNSVLFRQADHISLQFFCHYTIRILFDFGKFIWKKLLLNSACVWLICEKGQLQKEKPRRMLTFN